MSYLTKEELRKAPYSISEHEADNAHLDMLLELVKETIENITQQEFIESAQIEERLSGTGKITLFLPKRMTELIEIKDYLTEQSFNTFNKDNFHVRPYYLEWKSTARTSSRIIADRFTVGTANIGVVAKWGWKETPQPIRYVQGRMVKKLVSEGEMAVKKASESLGDYSFRMREDVNSITGDPELDMILKRYKRESIHDPA